MSTFHHSSLIFISSFISNPLPFGILPFALLFLTSSLPYIFTLSSHCISFFSDYLWYHHHFLIFSLASSYLAGDLRHQSYICDSTHNLLPAICNPLSFGVVSFIRSYLSITNLFSPSISSGCFSSFTCILFVKRNHVCGSQFKLVVCIIDHLIVGSSTFAILSEDDRC